MNAATRARALVVAWVAATACSDDYTDAAWQASVTDAALAHVIVQGGAAVGMSSMMPAATDLVDKPEVVAELVQLIRGFGAAAAR